MTENSIEDLTLKELISYIYKFNTNLGLWDSNPGIGIHLMLMVSEIVEAFEGWRKDKQDEHLLHRKALEVELADCIIRILSFSEYYNLDLIGAIKDKMEFNKTRLDHKFGNKPGIKKF